MRRNSQGYNTHLVYRIERRFSIVKVLKPFFFIVLKTCQSSFIYHSFFPSPRHSYNFLYFVSPFLSISWTRCVGTRPKVCGVRASFLSTITGPYNNNAINTTLPKANNLTVQEKSLRNRAIHQKLNQNNIPSYRGVCEYSR